MKENNNGNDTNVGSIENSIEEDIIKEFEKFCEDLYVFKDDDMGGHFEGIVGDQIANTKLGYLIFKEKLEDFLSDYKRKLKELEELKQEKQYYFEKYQYNLKQNENLTREFNNCIPVQKVKDKIEELKEQYNVRDLDFIKTTQDIRKIIIQSLEELIEEEK